MLVHRRRRARRVPAADDGVPLDPRAAQGRGHEPAVDRRRVRRDRGGVPVGLGPGAASASTRRSRSSRSCPLMMFAILFGLSMDYEVFLLSRIREEFLRTGDNRESVATGVAKTARVITSAALIMISVFLVFVLERPNPTVKMIGLGLAVAVSSTRRSSGSCSCRRRWSCSGRRTGGSRSGSTGSCRTSTSRAVRDPRPRVPTRSRTREPFRHLLRAAPRNPPGRSPSGSRSTRPSAGARFGSHSRYLRANIAKSVLGSLRGCADPSGTAPDDEHRGATGELPGRVHLDRRHRSRRR